MSAPAGRVECPSGCGRAVAPGKLMCAPCWHEVPTEIQRDVYRTWRKYKNANVNDPHALRASRQAYQAARDSALASIR